MKLVSFITSHQSVKKVEFHPSLPSQSVKHLEDDPSPPSVDVHRKSERENNGRGGKNVSVGTLIDFVTLFPTVPRFGRNEWIKESICRWRVERGAKRKAARYEAKWKTSGWRMKKESCRTDGRVKGSRLKRDASAHGRGWLAQRISSVQAWRKRDERKK